jgi:hypothetical protein
LIAAAFPLPAFAGERGRGARGSNYPFGGTITIT